MKRRLWTCFFGVLCCTASTVDLQAWDNFFEAKAAYFHPTNGKFRTIYSSRAIYGVEYTAQLYRPLYLWTSGDYYSSWGRSIGYRHRTHIYLVPVALGLKLMHRFNWLDIYFGAGGLGTYTHIKDYSPYVIHTSCKWGYGGIAKAGFLINLPNRFFIDAFADYSYMQVEFHKTRHHKVVRDDAHLSGWSVGGAIGFRFGPH